MAADPSLVRELYELRHQSWSATEEELWQKALQEKGTGVREDQTLYTVDGRVLYIPVSDEMAARMSQEWSEPVQVRIEDGHMILRTAEVHTGSKLP